MQTRRLVLAVLAGSLLAFGCNRADLAITGAEGKHQVATEACEAMSAADQEACKASAALEVPVAERRGTVLNVGDL